MPRVCPWWIGYTLLLPFRRLTQNPRTILAPYVRAGMRVAEPGPGMGFFTLELARRVGDDGRVLALDVQAKMLAALERRARRAGVAERIETRVVDESAPMPVEPGSLDFALLFYMLHEVPDSAAYLHELFAALKPGASVLFVEPARHLSRSGFEAECRAAREAGFVVRGGRPVAHSYSVVLEKPLNP